MTSSPEVTSLKTTIIELRAQLNRTQSAAEKERRAARKLRKDVVAQMR